MRPFNFQDLPNNDKLRLSVKHNLFSQSGCTPSKKIENAYTEHGYDFQKTHKIEYSGEEYSGIVDGEAFKKCINRTIPSPEMQFATSKKSKRLIINRHTDTFWINCLLLYRDEK